VEEWNGHNAFVHPLKFDELFQKKYYSSFLQRVKISHFVERWENARAITQYQKLDFVKKWSNTFVMSTIDTRTNMLHALRRSVSEA